jgi:hypothetical protein
MRRLYVVTVAVFLALAANSGRADATVAYSTRVVATSPVAAHAPWANGNFWLGDYIFLSIRDVSLAPNLSRKYRVCWRYNSFGHQGCRAGYLSRNWPASPPKLHVAFNDNITVQWFVGGPRIAVRKLHITGE